MKNNKICIVNLGYIGFHLANAFVLKDIYELNETQILDAKAVLNNPTWKS